MNDIKTIFLVDDDESFNFLTKIAFKKFKFPVKIVDRTSGSEAIKAIRELGVPHLILLDIRMPTMDGFELVSELENMGLDKKLRVVLLSSSHREVDKNRAAEYSSVIDYVEKPMQLDKMEDLIKQLYKDYIQ